MANGFGAELQLSTTQAMKQLDAIPGRMRAVFGAVEKDLQKTLNSAVGGVGKFRIQIDASDLRRQVLAALKNVSITPGGGGATVSKGGSTFKVDVDTRLAQRKLNALQQQLELMASRQKDPNRAGTLREMAADVRNDPNVSLSGVGAYLKKLDEIKVQWQEIDKAARKATSVSASPIVDVDTKKANTKLNALADKLRTLAAQQSDSSRAEQLNDLAFTASRAPVSMSLYNHLSNELAQLKKGWREIDSEERAATASAEKYNDAVSRGIGELESAKNSPGLKGNKDIETLQTQLKFDPQSVSQAAEGVRKKVQDTLRTARLQARVEIISDTAKQQGADLLEKVLDKRGVDSQPLFDPTADEEAIKRLKNAYEKLQTDLDNIRNSGGQKSVAQANQEVQGRMAAYQQELVGIQRVQQAKQRQNLQNAGRSNQFSAGIFQIQQAVEDFQAAGLRGAINNVAMLLSQLGGVGTAALAGIAVAQVAYAGFNAYLKETEQNVKDVAKEMSTDMRVRRANQQAVFNPISTGAQKAQAQGELEIESRRRNALQGNLDLLKQLEDQRSRMRLQAGGDVASGLLLGIPDAVGARTSETDAAGKAMDSIIKRLQERGVDTSKLSPNKGLGSYVRSLFTDQGLTEMIRQTENDLGTATEAAERAAAALRSFKDGMKMDDVRQSFAQTVQEVEKNLSRVRGLATEFAGEAFSQIQQDAGQKLQREITQIEKDLGEKMSMIRSAIAAAEDQMLSAKNPEDRAKARRALPELRQQYDVAGREYSNAVREAEQRTQALLQIDRDRLLILSNTEITLDAAKQGLEGQRSILQDIIQKESQRIQMLKQQAQDSKTGYGMSRDDAELSAKQNDINDQFTKGMENARLRAQNNIRQKFGPIQGLNGVWDQMRQAAEKQSQEELAAMERAWARRKEKLLKQAQEEATLKKSARLSDSVRNLGDTDAMSLNGEFDRAQANEERRRQLLQQQQQLMLNQGAQGGPKAAGFFAQADQIQKQIDASFQKSEEIANRAQQAANQRLQQTEQALKQIEALKTQISNIPLMKATDIPEMEKLLQQARDLLALKNQIAQGGFIGANPGGAGTPFFPAAPPAPARATGGGVSAGTPYMVGELGPEMFIPSGSGTIVSAQQTAGILAAAGTITAPVSRTTNTSSVTNAQQHIGQVNLNQFQIGTTEGQMLTTLSQMRKSERVRKGR